MDVSNSEGGDKNIGNLKAIKGPTRGAKSPASALQRRSDDNDEAGEQVPTTGPQATRATAARRRRGKGPSTATCGTGRLASESAGNCVVATTRPIIQIRFADEKRDDGYIPAERAGGRSANEAKKAKFN